jgi:NADPH2:quinone reductase
VKALCLDRFGGPELLQLRELADPEPTAGQAPVRVKSIGLNFADVYRRRGDYHIDGSPPYVLGYEGAGVVDASAFVSEHVRRRTIVVVFAAPPVDVGEV